MSSAALVFLAAAAATPQADLDVIIVGAGWSGMAAADALARADKKVNFVVLEATNRTGGRTHATQFGDPKIWRGTIERGSNWVSGVAPPGCEKGGAAGNAKGMKKMQYENPVYTLAKKAALALARVPGSADGNMSDYREVYHSDGTPGGDPGRKIRAAADKALDCINKTNFGRKVTMREGLQQCGWNPKTEEEYAVDWAMSGEDADGNQARKLSAANFLPDPTYQWWGPDDMFVVEQNPRGYAHLVDVMVADTLPPGDARLIFNTRVTNMKYDDKGVTVTAKDGRTWRAKEVICTLPLGSLKRNYKTLFDPPVNNKKEAALNGPFVMGNLTHVVAQFPTVWWDNSLVKWLQANAGSNKSAAGGPDGGGVNAAGELALQHNLNHAGFIPGSQALLSFYGDPQSSHFEAMSDEDAKAAYMKRIRAQHPSLTIPDPSDFFMSRHGFDENSYGAYSISFPKWNWADHKDLVRSLKDDNKNVRVRFAGEHTCDNLNGYTHGARQTGVETAAAYLYDNGLGPDPSDDPNLGLCSCC